MAVAGGSFTDTFERWGVHVYHFRIEPPPAPPPPPPPAPAPPPPLSPRRFRHPRLRRRCAPSSSAAASPRPAARAGRLFTIRLRVGTSTGAPVGAAVVRCTARVARSPLRPLVRRWSRGVATCTWRLPRTAKAKRLLASVRVQGRGSALTRSLARRVSR